MKKNILILLCITQYTLYGMYQYPTISSPGSYRLATNVTNQITIASSNVTLNMNGCTVSGGANGLVINSGLNNITIKNGIVSNVTTDGIQINGGTSNITLSEITVRNTTRAVACTNVTNATIDHCDFISSNTGLELNRCHNIMVENCIAQTNKDAGFSLISSTTCSLTNCQALSTGQGNNNLVGSIYGFINNDGQGNIFDRCIANATQGLTLTSASSVVAGFALVATGTQGHTIINCEASNSITNPNGFSETYGIYLAGASLTTLTDAAASATGEAYAGISVTWSPDGTFLAQVGTFNNTYDFSVYSFSRTSSFIPLAASLFPNDFASAVAWHPGSDIIVVGNNSGQNLLYFFDRLNYKLTLMQTISVGTAVQNIVWSTDGRYFVAAINSATTSAQIYSYDGINQRATLTSTYNAGFSSHDVSWSPSMQFIAVVGSSGNIHVLRFNATSSAFVTPAVATASIGTGTVASCEWSPDGNYLAVMGNATDGNGQVRIYRFTGTALTLTSGKTQSVGTAGDAEVHWSADMRYVIAAAQATVSTNSVLQLFSFDKGTGQLTSLSSKSLVGSFSGGTINACDWSPDGGYIAAAGDGRSNFPALRVYNAIQFPAGNTIMNNKVYCNMGGQFNSGTGIFGSSITNLIIGNVAFDNPFNYIFAQNVFNQIYGQNPSVLQNITTQPNVPILTPVNIPQVVDRTRLLLQSLVDVLI